MIGARKYDVAVIGGGIAGCAAALSAARMGKRTVLVERSVTLGGLATNGLIDWWEPMCDGLGEQLVYGISEEMLKRAVAYGTNTIPPCWREGGTSEERRSAAQLSKTEGRYVSGFSPVLLSLSLLHWLREEGVEVIFDALMTKVCVKGDAVTHLTLATQSGTERLCAARYIDATGSAEVFFRVGFPTREGQNAFTYVAHVGERTEDGGAPFRRKWHYLGVASPWLNRDSGERVAGTTREEVNFFVQNGQLCLYKDVAAGNVKGELLALPSMPQFRTIRCVEGAYVLRGEDANTCLQDSLCVGGDFEQKGVWYEIPYRCFYNRRAKNVVAAGRIVSASDAAWNAVRVIPIAALTGEVSGVIAARSLEEGKPVSDLDASMLQAQLQARGIRLHGTR